MKSELISPASIVIDFVIAVVASPVCPNELVTEPTVFKLLHRINSIDEITVTPEAIDASALEDLQTRNIAGRDTVTDTVAVTVNKTEATIKEWKDLITEYKALTDGKRMS